MNASQATAKCLNCGRTLSSDGSIARGYGRTCARKIRTATNAADLNGFKATQIADAVELIEDAAIVQIRPRVYRSVSSDGTALYLTAATGQCNCPAGLRSVRCYHVAAARMLAAA